VPRLGRMAVKNTFLTVEEEPEFAHLPRSRTLPATSILGEDPMKPATIPVNIEPWVAAATSEEEGYNMPSPTFLHGCHGAQSLVRHASFFGDHTDDLLDAAISIGNAGSQALGSREDVPERTPLSALGTQGSRSSAPSSSQVEASVEPRVSRAGRFCVKNTFLTVQDKRAADVLPRSRTLPTPALLSIDEQDEEKFGNRYMDDPMFMNMGAPNPSAVGDLSDALGLEPAPNVPRPLFLERLSGRGQSPENSTARSVSDWSVRSQDLPSLRCPMSYNRDLPEGWDVDSGGLPSPPLQHEDTFDMMRDLPRQPSPPSVLQDALGSPPASSSSDVQEGEVKVSRRVKVKNTFLTVEEPAVDMTMIPRSRTLPVPSSLSSLDPCDNANSRDQDGPVLAKLDTLLSANWSMPTCGTGPLSVNSLTEPTISSTGLVSHCPSYTANIPETGGSSAAFIPRMSMFDK